MQRLLTTCALSVFMFTPGIAYADQVTITFSVDSTPVTVAAAEQLIADFEAANADINVELEVRPQGSEGDNLVKTQLAVGEMSDVFRYNSGSLFQALNPDRTLVDLSNEAWQSEILGSFKPTVTSTDGAVRGAPIGPAGAGGILYNKPIYEELGLIVPKTWDEFMANNAKIKEAGKVPVIQTFGSTWTSQLLLLGDFFNVQAAVPTFAADYTAGNAKFATTPAALAGFQHGEDIYKAGYLNEDAGAATFEEGLAKVASGDGAHYPMFPNGLAGMPAEEVQTVGFFPVPGSSAESHGLTVWMPDAVYIPQSSQHIEEAKKFVAFIASVDGCESQVAAGATTGPYLVKGCTLPEDVLPVVSDLLPYFQQEGTTAPALEFLSPIKGPSLEQILVEIGSGIRSAADGAALYDEDARKQAQQLGLSGW